jgi:hypothetical protein
MLEAMSIMSRVGDKASTAKCYAMSCFHNYNDHYARVALDSLIEARAQLDRAEAMIKECLANDRP